MQFCACPTMHVDTTGVSTHLERYNNECDHHISDHQMRHQKIHSWLPSSRAHQRGEYRHVPHRAHHKQSTIHSYHHLMFRCWYCHIIRFSEVRRHIRGEVIPEIFVHAHWFGGFDILCHFKFFITNYTYTKKQKLTSS